MEKKELEKKYGQVWNTMDLLSDFVVESFLAPFVEVTRKKYGAKGLLEFQHRPRFYFDFVPH